MDGAAYVNGAGWVSAVVALGLGYLLGSVPFGLVLTRLAGTADLRSIGSGNIGATNVLRTGRKDLAALTLLLDGFKGTLAVLLARQAFGDSAEAMGSIAAVGAFLGHVYPVWLRFRGGKGVATYLGCLFGLWWPAAAAFALVWLIVAALSRFSSAAALVASLATPMVLALAGRGGAAGVFGALTLLLWWKHRTNLQRLARGCESRIGRSA